jgi:hypothetical protein
MASADCCAFSLRGSVCALIERLKLFTGRTYPIGECKFHCLGEEPDLKRPCWEFMRADVITTFILIR